MTIEYRRPSRLARLLRSGGLFWGGFAVVAIALGAYIANAL